jgi:WhiB family transcriptional regulator, redox-sensing transcriptional regulator
MDTDWMSQGKCRDMDPDVFFPSDGVGVQAAQRVCLVCPVKAPCLEYALAHHIHEGVWGGTSERERRRLLRYRRAATAPMTAVVTTAATAATTAAASLPAMHAEPAGRH